MTPVLVACECEACSRRFAVRDGAPISCPRCGGSSANALGVLPPRRRTAPPALTLGPRPLTPTEEGARA